MQLNWVKPAQGGWFLLSALDLPNTKIDGVYVIGVEGGGIVRTGQGFIENRLSQHRNDPVVLSYATSQARLVTAWAEVDWVWQDGVEVYLENTLKPAIRTQLPVAWPIQVNLP